MRSCRSGSVAAELPLRGLGFKALMQLVWCPQATCIYFAALIHLQVPHIDPVAALQSYSYRWWMMALDWRLWRP